MTAAELQCGEEEKKTEYNRLSLTKSWRAGRLKGKIGCINNNIEKFLSNIVVNTEQVKGESCLFLTYLF